MTARSPDLPLPRMPGFRPGNFWKWLPAGLVLFLVAGMATTGYTYLEPGEVAVIKNNLTGAETVRTESGMILHLPFGLTDVYKLDRRVQVFTMGRNVARIRGRRVRTDQVKIKVRDGSNVEVDVEVNFQVIPQAAAHLIKRVGPGDAFKFKMIRSYTRAFIREKYGGLTLEEVSDAAVRKQKNDEVRAALNEALEPFGVEVTLVNTTNITFNPEYERLVREKKATAQEFANQKAAQETALKEQEAKVAAALREKNTALITARGEARKRLVEAENKAKQLLFRARGEAYAKRKEGDRLFEVARQEALAIEKEGLAKAAGLRALVAAYSRGGLALVKEALARKLTGSKLRGRPYTLTEAVQRLRVEHGAAGSQREGR